ncbi:MurR/RpiR family transcriptional regulator [Lactococcus fujiensis]|uniref:Transcriptional regulator n=1 Tax=Lactococcus fujiensis JCM 16395 TaxID=1291764 RepID=A0A2A5RPP1_9LACT|nr:MurR/RpiR family transcriptional regulator [Lactococcus fujiensis]PCS01392.1 transcriptional regulator [Lactococcus fujiensis JCM 16395]
MTNQKLSNAESYTWQIIQEHYKQVPKLSISEIADLAHVSISTVNRTVKKKGYAGYADFRYSLEKKELPQIQGFSSEVLVAISKNEEELLYTIHGISAESIENAVQLIDSASEILLFAQGLSANAAKEMMKKLQLFHKKVNLYSESAEMLYYANFTNAKSLVIVLSLSGETDEIIKALKAAKQKHAVAIGLTVSSNSRLARLADVSLVGYKSPLEVNYFDLDVHSRLPLYILVRVLFDAFSIFQKRK